MISARIAGALVLLIALSHFLLPTLGYRPDDLAAIPTAQRAHFVHLGTYAIGSFLLTFAIVTWAAARAPDQPLARLFFALMTLTWSFRLWLELQFPVDLSLFVITRPHPLLATVIGCIAACYGLATHHALRRR